MKLEIYLKRIYNLPDDPKLLTVLDMIGIYSDFDKYQENLKTFAKDFNKQNSSDPNELSILEYETSPYRYLLYLIRQNHYTNYYVDLELILNGINSPCTKEVLEQNIKIVDYMYEKKENILLMDKTIINIYKKIISCKYPLSEKYDLKKFYNMKSLKKFIKTLDLKIPSSFNDKLPPNTVLKLKSMYEILIKSSSLTKKYIQKLFESNVFVKLDETKYGLSNFDPEFYMFNLSYMCGLKFKSISEIEHLYEWAHKYLKYNTDQIRKTIKKIYPNVGTSLSQLSHKDLIKMMNNDQQYRFKSEEELKKAYIDKIDEYHELMIKNNIPLTNKCGFITFNNAETAEGYYSNNCFHLNIANWYTKKKFGTRALTMHEAYPGHHMQLDISAHHNKNNYLTVLYPDIFCAFTEGWALFAEKIHSEQDLISDFGELDSDLLRILRIIADIDIHYKGKSPTEVIEKMSSYLALDKLMIIQEVYRYLALPAQAISYKIGESIFMGIYYKLKKEMGSNIRIDDAKMINEYIKILLQGEVTSEELLKKHSMRFFY